MRSFRERSSTHIPQRTRRRKAKSSTFHNSMEHQQAEKWLTWPPRNGNRNIDKLFGNHSTVVDVDSVIHYNAEPMTATVEILTHFESSHTLPDDGSKNNACLQGARVRRAFVFVFFPRRENPMLVSDCRALHHISTSQTSHQRLIDSRAISQHGQIWNTMDSSRNLMEPSGCQLVI